jgi:small subunit ribosomal protein S6
MRTYEIMFIVRPDVEEADLDKLIETFSGYVTSGGGEVKAVEKMGRRRLAYTVRKFNDGFYVLFMVATDGNQVGELERRLRVTEQVIKFITVRTDEEDKRLAKVKALRDSKVKRSALPAAHAAPAPVASISAEAAPEQDPAKIAEEATENAAEAGVVTAASPEAETPAVETVEASA